MAKAKVICTCAKCGATFEVTKDCYNRRDAEKWESWAGSHYDECPDCYKVRMQQEREAANAAAIEKSRGAGFPDLTGSEKQIAWAGSIRQRFVDDLFPLDKVTDRGLECLTEFMADHTDSRFWIDHRNNSLKIRDMVHDLWYEKYAEKKDWSSAWFGKNDQQ